MNQDDLIKQIEKAEANEVIHLNGIYRFQINASKTFIVGNRLAAGIVVISKSNVTIDGTGAKIVVEAEDINCETDIFKLMKDASNVHLNNLDIEVNVSGKNCRGTINIIYNCGRNNKVSNSRISIIGSCQFNAAGIYNYGGLDTHLGTPADGLTVQGCSINIVSTAADFSYENRLVGIINNLANSVCFSNNYIFIQNAGNSEKQKAYGIMNSGRFARIENNNIKANGSHSLGKHLEQAFACGMHNTGLYMVFTGNNCIAEWCGKGMGLYNDGAFANIACNKILATHTIMGRTVILAEMHCILSNNIITNTSRNPHFVDIYKGDNIINGNFMQGLMDIADYRSGCGIFMCGTSDWRVSRCNISNNIISCARDIGIVLINTERNIVSGNQFRKIEGADDYLSVYAENSDDKISDNIMDGYTSINTSEHKDRLNRNFDDAVCSIIE